MRKFMKDYKHLCGETGEFYKNHWFGCIVMNLLVAAPMCIYAFLNCRKFDKNLESLHKEEES